MIYPTIGLSRRPASTGTRWRRGRPPTSTMSRAISSFEVLVVTCDSSQSPSRITAMPAVPRKRYIGTRTITWPMSTLAPTNPSRRRDPDDRRRHIVEITPRGKKGREHAQHAMATVEQDLLHALSPSERVTLHQLVRRILESQAASAKAEATRA